MRASQEGFFGEGAYPLIPPAPFSHGGEKGEKSGRGRAGSSDTREEQFT